MTALYFLTSIISLTSAPFLSNSPSFDVIFSPIFVAVFLAWPASVSLKPFTSTISSLNSFVGILKVFATALNIVSGDLSLSIICLFKYSILLVAKSSKDLFQTSLVLSVVFAISFTLSAKSLLLLTKSLKKFFAPFTFSGSNLYALFLNAENTCFK